MKIKSINTTFFNQTDRSSFCLVGVLLAIMLSALAFTSCDSDKVGDNYYTFTEDMIGDHLINNPNDYSEFVKMLDTTKVLGLLKAYGNYTCFAPTNDAIYEFYKSQNRTSLKDYPYDTIVKIVYDHIIKDFKIISDDFKEGRLPYLSMSSRYLSISYAQSSTKQIVKVNKTSTILDKNIPAHNGVIHKIDQVLKPTEKSLVEAIGADKKFTLFSEALNVTQLYKKLALVEDKTYDPSTFDYELGTNNGNDEVFPEFRKYGYTALIESDATYLENGISDLESLKERAKLIYDKVYPEDKDVTDVTDPRNSLYRFVAYHLINKQIGLTKFIIDYDNTGHQLKSYDMFEYIETLNGGAFIEVRTHRQSNKTNLFNYVGEENAGSFIEINPDYHDVDAINGVYHEINSILSYNLDVVTSVSSKRLRLDAASFFPEFTNNNMRGNGVVVPYIIPPGFLDRLKLTEGTVFCYLNADSRYEDFQGDEIFLRGLYDFTITTPVIPKGTYEIRFAYQPTGGRGAAQLYWDSIPCGIPLDLTKDADDASIGYIEPGKDPSDPLGFENDKMMRNRGYLKGPGSYRVVTHEYYPAANARVSNRSLRRILGIYTFNEATEHKFKVKAAREGQFMMDYLEFVPTELIEREDVY